MIRAILIAPVSLLTQAEQFIGNALGETADAFGLQRWQDRSGARFAVAAGVFSEAALQMAPSYETPIAIVRAGDSSETAVSGITLAISNSPLETLKKMGLMPVDPVAGPDEGGAIQ